MLATKPYPWVDGCYCSTVRSDSKKAGANLWVWSPGAYGRWQPFETPLNCIGGTQTSGECAWGGGVSIPAVFHGCQFSKLWTGDQLSVLYKIQMATLWFGVFAGFTQLDTGYQFYTPGSGALLPDVALVSNYGPEFGFPSGSGLGPLTHFCWGSVVGPSI